MGLSASPSSAADTGAILFQWAAGSHLFGRPRKSCDANQR